MSTVRFSQVTFATKSWVAEAWEKMVVELFSGRVVAEVKQLDEVCESKWEVELKTLRFYDTRKWECFVNGRWTTYVFEELAGKEKRSDYASLYRGENTLGTCSVYSSIITCTNNSWRS